MSYTTRCPACGTLFRVVADQLKISDGWVRCGHCSDVFDATVHLAPWTPPTPPTPAAQPARGADVPAPEAVPVPPAAPTPAATPAPAPAPAPAASPVSGGAAMPDDDDLHAWFGEGPLDAPAASAQVEPVATPMPGPAQVPEPEPEPVPRMPAPAPTDAERDEGPSSEFEAELHRFVQSARELAPAPDIARQPPDTGTAEGPPSRAPDAVPGGGHVASPAADADDEGAVPGFVRQAQRQAFWTSPGMRVLLVLIAVLAALVLAGQWALQHRHDLAARYPQGRPWIAQACAYLGCDLAPVQRIDAVEIESAQLVRRLGNFYSFDFVLRNRAAVEVAAPALELTLTNTLDRPVVRRVFLPADWPDAPAALPPQGTVSVSLRLSISLDDAAPTAGYRALVFYP